MKNLNARGLLQALGIGNFSLTMIIPFMFIAPASCDPKSPAIMLLVKHLQHALGGAGWPLTVNGYLDQQTANVLSHVVGAGWESLPWSDVVKGVIDHKDAPVTQAGPVMLPDPGSGMGGLPLGLPDVPGGVLTYAAVGIAAYLYWKRKH